MASGTSTTASIKDGACFAFGHRIFETSIAYRVFWFNPGLAIVTGYYGYGKTYGIGGYVICKAMEKGDYYLYVNMRKLSNLIKRPVVESSSLVEIFRTLYIALIEDKKSLSELSNENIIDTNISNLEIRLKNISNMFDKEDLVKIITQLFPEREKAVINSAKLPLLHLIIDELESVAPDVRSMVNQICRDARQLYDSKARWVKMYLLLQKALLLGSYITKPECADSAASGITATHELKGYTKEDYITIIKGLGIKYDNQKQIEKISEKLTRLPPRAVFEILQRSTTIEEVEFALQRLAESGRERFFLTVPRDRDLKVTIEQILNQLKQDNIIRDYKEVYTNILRKMFAYEVNINCEAKGEKKKSINPVLCFDLRENRKEKLSNIKCDITLVVRNGRLSAEGDTGGEDLGLILAAYYPEDSTIIQGLKELYKEIKYSANKYIGRLLKNVCV